MKAKPRDLTDFPSQAVFHLSSPPNDSFMFDRNVKFIDRHRGTENFFSAWCSPERLSQTISNFKLNFQDFSFITKWLPPHGRASWLETCSLDKGSQVKRSGIISARHLDAILIKALWIVILDITIGHWYKSRHCADNSWSHSALKAT
jgi:hypothetical protein